MYVFACTTLIPECFLYHWFLTQWCSCSIQYQVYTFQSLRKLLNLVRPIFLSSLNVKRSSTKVEVNTQLYVCYLFFFPSCAVRDKPGLFVQQLIVRLTCWRPQTGLSSTCFQPRKDFLLVMLVPVWTGKSDERRTLWRSGQGLQGALLVPFHCCQHLECL